MPQIQNAGLVRRIERHFGLRGEPGPGTVSPEIVPVSIVDAIRPDKTEIRRCVGAATSLSGVADFPHVQLVLRAGRGVVTENISAVISTDNTQVIQLRQFDTSAGVLVAPSFSDLRVTGLPATELFFDEAAPAHGAKVSLQIDALADTVYQFDLPWVLVPGTGINFHGTIFSSAIAVSWAWTERELEADD